jgi:gamma-glutamyltranspeptidase
MYIKAMIRNLWLGEDIKEAIDSPRFHHQLFPMTLNYEKSFPKVLQLAYYTFKIYITITKCCVLYGRY